MRHLIPRTNRPIDSAIRKAFLQCCIWTSGRIVPSVGRRILTVLLRKTRKGPQSGKSSIPEYRKRGLITGILVAILVLLISRITRDLMRYERDSQIYTPYMLGLHFWVRDKGNWVMANFQKMSIAEVSTNFNTPTGKSVVDPELVAAFASMEKGEGLKLQKDPTLKERQLKVRVGKAAKDANRKIDWAVVEDGYIARVIEILTPASNGAVATTNVTPTPPTTDNTPATPASSRRG